MADSLTYPLYGGDTLNLDAVNLSDIEIAGRDTTIPGNSQHKKFTAEDLKQKVLGEIQTAAKITQRKEDGTVTSWPASDSSPEAGEIAMRAALAAYQQGDVYIIESGSINVTAGNPLTNSLPSGITKAPIFFADSEGRVLYEDEWNDPQTDCECYYGPRNILNFGAVLYTHNHIDSRKAVQAAIMSLPSANETEFTEDGFLARSGEVFFPKGYCFISDEIVTSAHVKLYGISSVSQVVMLAGSAPSASSDKWMIRVSRTLIGGNPAANFTQGVVIENLSFLAEPTGNENAKGLQIYGAQSTFISGVIGHFNREGVYIGNESVDITLRLWMVGGFPTGPGLLVDGCQGLNIDFLSIEHANHGVTGGSMGPLRFIDLTFSDSIFINPAVELNYCNMTRIGSLQSEAVDVQLRAFRCNGLTIEKSFIRTPNPPYSTTSQIELVDCQNTELPLIVGGHCDNLLRVMDINGNVLKSIPGNPVAFATGRYSEIISGESLVANRSLSFPLPVPNGIRDSFFWIPSEQGLFLGSNSTDLANPENWFGIYENQMPGNPGFHASFFPGAAQNSRGLSVQGYLEARDGFGVKYLTNIPQVSDLREGMFFVVRESTSSQINLWTVVGGQRYKLGPFTAYP